MAEYNLQPNEAMILKSKSVSHGFWGAYTDEILLTSQNFIWTSIGIYGFPKKVYQYPLSQIKVSDGRAQVFQGEHSGNKSPMLDIYFINGQNEQFGFQVSKKNAQKEILNWMKAINKAVTGNSIDEELDEKFSNKGNDALPGTELITETLKGSIDTIIGAFGLKNSKTSNSNVKLEKIAKKCSSCGAPVSGIKGQIVKCQYCDTAQQL